MLDSATRAALLRIKEKEFEFVRDDENWRPSRRFRKRALHTIRSVDAREKRTTKIRRIVLFIAAIISACAVLMSFDGIREPVINFFVNVYETFSELVAPATNESLPTGFISDPDYIPEGFRLVRQEKSDMQTMICIRSETLGEIVWKVLDARHTVTFNNEGGTSTTRVCCGLTWYLHDNGRKRQMYTVYGDRIIEIICDSRINIEEIDKIIRSALSKNG